jgi:hypothetical protein
MAKYGNYGWSPRQMERINERRAKRGQEELRNRRYEGEPEEERQSPSVRPMPSPIGKEEDIDMKGEAEERTRKFREKFKPKGSMGIERGVKSNFPSVIKKGIRGGVGTSMQDSFNQFTA